MILRQLLQYAEDFLTGFSHTCPFVVCLMNDLKSVLMAVDGKADDDDDDHNHDDDDDAHADHHHHHHRHFGLRCISLVRWHFGCYNAVRWHFRNTQGHPWYVERTHCQER